MKMIIKLSSITLLFCLIFQSVIIVTPENNQDSLLNVVATTEIIASIVDTIGKPYVNTSYILPEGADIHEYSLSPNDITKIEKADLIVLVNSSFFGLEAQIRHYAEEYNKLILDYNNYSMNILEIPDFGKNFHGIWLYPDNALAIATAIYNTLCKLIPEKKDIFLKNLEEFKQKINSLKQFLYETARNLNLLGTNAVVVVPGVAYIVAAFGIHVVGTLMAGPGESINPSKLNTYLQRAKSGEIKFIACPEHLENTKIGEITRDFSEEADIPIVYFRIFSIANLKDYFALMSYNAAMLKSAFSFTTGASPEYDVFYVIIASLLIIVLVESIVIWRYRKSLGE